jgi:hypothetical protein
LLGYLKARLKARETFFASTLKDGPEHNLESLPFSTNKSETNKKDHATNDVHAGVYLGDTASCDGRSVDMKVQ